MAGERDDDVTFADDALDLHPVRGHHCRTDPLLGQQVHQPLDVDRRIDRDHGVALVPQDVGDDDQYSHLLAGSVSPITW